MNDTSTTAANRDGTGPMTKRERTARSFATAMIRMGWRSRDQQQSADDMLVLPTPVANSAVKFADALFDALEQRVPNTDTGSQEPPSQPGDDAAQAPTTSLSCPQGSLAMSLDPAPRNTGKKDGEPGTDEEGTRERRKYTLSIDLWANDDNGVASASVAVENHQGGHSLERHPITGYTSVADALNHAVGEAGAYMRDLEDIDAKTQATT